MPFERATNFASLGKWTEALETLEDLPAEERMKPDVLMLRLRCCVGLEKWALGDALAEMLRLGNPTNREAAARFWHALARVEVEAENLDFAQAAIKKALVTWPEILPELQADPLLERIT